LGDATVKADMHVDTGLCTSPRSDPHRGPSSTLRRARPALGTPHDGDSRPVFGREL